MSKRLNQSQGFFEMPFHCIFFFFLRDDFGKIGMSPWEVSISGWVSQSWSVLTATHPPTPASLSTDSVDTEVVEIACLFWMRQPVLKQSWQNPGLENFRERALGAPVTMRSVSRVFFPG